MTIAASRPVQIGAPPDIDRVNPEGAWTFDTEVARVFDNMLERSIPQYDDMRRTVFACGSEFVAPGATIVDCGASRGAAIAPFIEALRGQGRFVCIETSEPMVQALRERFAGERAVEIHHGDIREVCPDVRADLTLSVLTLQFIPIEHRQRLVREIYERTAPGGAFILVEKVLGADSGLNDLMVRLYHEHKMQHGYSRDAIDRKALSLQGVLVPVTAQWNVELLRQAGFRQIDCFWRWMNFGAWIAVKSD